MKLRTLEYRDASFMLEWMHDTSVVKNMKFNFADCSINDCYSFIKNSVEYKENIHLAITNDDDIYMGTVSLKHILNETAEFAIVIRKEAMGRGYSVYGMKEVLDRGFEKYGLEKIYWCVEKKNIRAIKFYKKNGYEPIEVKQSSLLPIIQTFYSKKNIEDYLWYEVRKEKGKENYDKSRSEKKINNFSKLM